MSMRSSCKETLRAPLFSFFRHDDDARRIGLKGTHHPRGEAGLPNFLKWKKNQINEIHRSATVIRAQGKHAPISQIIPNEDEQATIAQARRQTNKVLRGQREIRFKQVVEPNYWCTEDVGHSSAQSEAQLLPINKKTLSNESKTPPKPLEGVGFERPMHSLFKP